MRVLLIAASLGLAFGAWQAVDLWWSWRSVERKSFDQASFDALGPVGVEELAAGAEGAEELPAEVLESLTAAAGSTDGDGDGDDGAEADGASDPAADPFDSYLIVGSDEGDQRADVIILVLLPNDGSNAVMVSLPRDLYLPNRCTRGLTRINANLNGCGPDLNGPTQLAGAVEDFTGIEVDHFALFTMDGFERIIDAVGGMEICVDHRVRDHDTPLDLPAGCTLADGEMTLGWVRSRKTQEFVDGRWRTMPGVNDLTRNQRQQDLILTVLGKVGEFDSPGDLTEFAASLSDTFTLDDRLGLTDAVDLAWTHRDFSTDELVRLTIPVQPHTTSAGAQVLLPTTPFAELLAETR